MKKTPRLSIENRVRAVVHAKRCEEPAKRLTVSEVCRDAGINRANLYANHRPLLDELFPYLRARETRLKHARTSTIERRKVPDLKEVNRALLYVCLELQMEVRSLRSRLAEHPRNKKR
jgi:hypothetical protein